MHLVHQVPGPSGARIHLSAGPSGTRIYLVRPVPGSTWTVRYQDAPGPSGTCSDISEGQCRILPYNQSGVLPGATVVKSGELEMFLKFFSYLNRLSCYRHIMLFGCAIALPQCIQQSNSRSGGRGRRSECGGGADAVSVGEGPTL
ncbi:hypothetical protein P4O66_004014 [Electrophorus voltai]|uniref:Uncharacterized protein n=1 Tax=Electrophorus voltai TaxID=2609070 RepID=A0AAD8ZQ17_9TELE|nr:hypothetical protein P4O66_004014 [Electrophorus voltai]